MHRKKQYLVSAEGTSDQPSPVASPHRAVPERQPAGHRRRISARRRRLALSLIAGATVLAAAACGSSSAGSGSSSGSSHTVPLTINSTTTQVALQLDGQKLPFPVSWVGGASFKGPDAVNAMRGGHLDIGGGRTVVPIQAKSSGLDLKIVGVQTYSSPTDYVVTAPGSSIKSVADLKGKRVAISPGQGTGVLTLLALQDAGLSFKQVHFVQLSDTDDIAALEGGQVDAATVSVMNVGAYLQKYPTARILQKSEDMALTLYVPASVLKDKTKAAEVREFVKVWQQQTVWEWTHPQQWLEGYFVKNQGLDLSVAKTAFQQSKEKPEFPDNWDEVIKWTQNENKLVNQAGWFKPLDVPALFDRSFEKISDQAVAAQYRVNISAPKV
jgi:sulfonate transport system substrate-binding protein